MAACSFSNAVDKRNYEKREKAYLDTINKYDKIDQRLFSKLLAQITMALQQNPDQDLLGSLFMELGLGSSDRGQFFTPYNVCKMMSAITIGDVTTLVNENDYISICDCACGAGATLIAAINESKEQLSKVGKNFQRYILVVAQDIDETVALMCYIQLSLLGVAGYVKVGDTLSDPITPNDNYEKYWTTPMYYILPGPWLGNQKEKRIWLKKN